MCWVLEICGVRGNSEVIVICVTAPRVQCLLTVPQLEHFPSDQPRPRPASSESGSSRTSLCRLHLLEQSQFRFIQAGQKWGDTVLSLLVVKAQQFQKEYGLIKSTNQPRSFSDWLAQWHCNMKWEYQCDMLFALYPIQSTFCRLHGVQGFLLMQWHDGKLSLKQFSVFCLCMYFTGCKFWKWQPAGFLVWAFSTPWHYDFISLRLP